MERRLQIVGPGSHRARQMLLDERNQPNLMSLVPESRQHSEVQFPRMQARVAPQRAWEL
jgi:hypothetical protein